MSTEMIAGNTQIGTNVWCDANCDCDKYLGTRETPGTNSNGNDLWLSNDPTSSGWYTKLQAGYNAGGANCTPMDFGYNLGLNQLNGGLLDDGGAPAAPRSSLGDRTLDPAYRRIHIFVTDGADNCTPAVAGQGVGCAQQGTAPSPAGSAAALSGQPTITSRVIGVFASTTGGNPGNLDDLESIACTGNYSSSPNIFNVGTNAGVSNPPERVANDIAHTACTLPPVCTCPPDYVRISQLADGTAPPHIVLGPGVNCESEGKVGICRKLECECDPSNLPMPTIPTTTTGICPADILPNGIALWYNDVTHVGDPHWENPNPLICHYNYECCLDGVTQRGGIWKHNDRCDLYVNYYTYDHPWEIEWVESVGQTVNTVRSIEYQLESYIYKGVLDDNCGDRFHDLDWNFDSAILHNTEQVSGLLQLTLTPKNNVPLITQWPIITGNDIEILYSKEEQKYRFNMFWDITRDRGEFDPNENASIFITQLNGYIRDLNAANLNYFKPAFQRKRFRHYWNKVILRKNVSENRKMILKLANTKINASFR